MMRTEDIANALITGLIRMMSVTILSQMMLIIRKRGKFVLWTMLFIVLNILNGCVISLSGYGVDTWQYWISTICVCGSYLMGGCKYIFKED